MAALPANAAAVPLVGAEVGAGSGEASAVTADAGLGAECSQGASGDCVSPSRLRRLSMIALAPLSGVGPFSALAAPGRRLRRRRPDAEASAEGGDAAGAGGESWRAPSVWWLGPGLLMQWFCAIGPSAYLQAAGKHYYGLDSALVITSVMALRGVLSMAVSPWLGAMSDRSGRRRVQAWKVGITMLPQLFFGFGPDTKFFHGDLAFSSFVLTGLAGNYFGLAFAYCADIVLKGRTTRSLNATISMALVISFTPAFILAPLICNAIANNYGDQVMWRALFCLGCVNVLYSLFVLPESLDDGAAASAPGTPSAGGSPLSPASDASPTSPTAVAERTVPKNPLRAFRLLSSTGPAGPEAALALRRICFVLFFLYCAKWSMIGVTLLYAQLHFGWSPQRSNILITVWGISQCVSMGGLTVAEKHLVSISRARRERIMSWLGLFMGLAGMLMLLAGSIVDTLLIPALAIGATSMVTYTALSSQAGHLVHASMIGEVQSLVSTTLDLSDVIGPPVFGVMIRSSLSPSSKLPASSPFILAAILVVVAIVGNLFVPKEEERLAPMVDAADAGATTSAATAGAAGDDTTEATRCGGAREGSGKRDIGESPSDF